MTRRPRVSVIIPSYNGEPYVGRAIESVLSQSYPDFEVRVVDDASTDGTPAVVAKYLADPRVHYSRQETNRGPSAARNRGIRESAGELVAFLDADDYWAPGKLEAQVAAMADPAVGACAVAAWYLMPGDVVVVTAKRPPFGGDALYRELLFTNSVPAGTSGVLVRRRCLEEVGLFDEELRGSEDRDLWVRLAGRCGFVFVDTPLVYFNRRRTDSAVRDRVRMARGREAFLRNRERDMPPHLRPALPALRRATYLFIAGTLAKAGDAKSCRRYCLRAIAASPKADRKMWAATRLLARSFVPWHVAEATRAARGSVYHSSPR